MKAEFESWWPASKYCQVAYGDPYSEQVAWDAWQAAYKQALEDAAKLASQPRILNSWPMDGRCAVNNYAAAIRQSILGT